MEYTFFVVFLTLMGVLVGMALAFLLSAALCRGCSCDRKNALADRAQAEIRALGDETRREIDTAADDYLKQISDEMGRKP